MSLISKLAWIFLFPSGCIALLYSAFGVFVFSLANSVRGLEDLLALGFPLIVFPLFCLCFWSLSVATGLSWIAWLVRYAIWVLIAWPHLNQLKFASIPEETALVGLFLMTLALCVDKFTRRNKYPTTSLS